MGRPLPRHIRQHHIAAYNAKVGRVVLVTNMVTKQPTLWARFVALFA